MVYCTLSGICEGWNWSTDSLSRRFAAPSFSKRMKDANSSQSTVPSLFASIRRNSFSSSSRLPAGRMPGGLGGRGEMERVTCYLVLRQRTMLQRELPSSPRTIKGCDKLVNVEISSSVRVSLLEFFTELQHNLKPGPDE